MSLAGATDELKLQALSTKTYKEQAIWFLNAFWHRVEKDAELIWKYVHRMVELDAPKGANGNELDEMMAHRFLETFDETMTVRQMRENLRSVGVERVRFVPLSHFLIFRFGFDWHTLVNATQGDNQAEVEEAQRRLNEVQSAFVQVQATAKASAEREAEAKRAQEELTAALLELKAQEDAYNNKKADLERKSEEGGVVSRNKAKAELAQHLAEDPLPLRRAKINQEAAVRKAEKATQIASDARAVASAAADQASSARAQAEKDARDATAARAAAEQAAAESARAAEAAEAALEATRQAFAEAEAYLNEIRSRPGSANGALWWIDRELHEAKAYLPASKGGYSKAK